MDNPALPACRAVMRAINSRDLSVIEQVVTADFVDHGAPPGLPAGPEGYRRMLGFLTHVLQLSYELLDEIVTPDRIVVRAVGHGVAVAQLHGPSAAGKPYTMDTIHIFRTEGDRLAEHWGVRDELGVLIGLGRLPAPDLAALVAPIPG